MKKSWFRNLFARPARPSQSRPRRTGAGARPLIEVLEDRRVPAVFTIGPATQTVAEGNLSVEIVVTRDSLFAPSATSDTIDVRTVAGSATPGADFAPLTQTLTFPPDVLTFSGSIQSQTLTVTIVNDSLDEADETFTVTLSNPNPPPPGNTISGGPATVTIQDDDPAPTVTIGNASVTEGNSGPVTANVPVILSAASGQDVTVPFSTQDGTATSDGGDYQAASGTLTIPAGQTTVSISVTVNGDTLVEGNENFLVTLGVPVTNANLGTPSTGTVTILDDDATLSISDVTVTEGNSGTVAATFTVTLSAAPPGQITVNFATADGTATAGSDFVAASGTLTFSGGITTQTVTVQVNGDTLLENNETFVVNLSNPSGAALADSQGLGTITNDDFPTASISDVTVSEGNSGTVAATFTVTLSAPQSATATVNFATADGSATAGTDYVAASGTLTFTANVTTQTITVLVNGDTLFEGNEVFLVNLSNPTNATLLDSQGSGTITDDEVVNLLTADSAFFTTVEGTGGSTNLVFTFTLNNASGVDSTFGFNTVDQTATAGSDYTATSGVVTIPAGQTTASVTVAVNPDAVDEPDEMFVLDITPMSNLNFQLPDPVGVITDDDDPPTADIVDVAPDPRNTPVDTLDIVFSEAVSGFDLADLALTNDPDGTGPAAPAPVSLAGAGLATVDNITYTLSGLTGATSQSGTYVLTLTAAGSAIADAGNDPLAADAVESFDIDLVAPTVFIQPVTPDPRTVPVDTVMILFTEPVLGFDLADLALTRDGTPVDISAANLASPDGQTFTLSGLTPFTTTPGNYVLTLDETTAGITDMAGSALALGASEAFAVVVPDLTIGDVSAPEAGGAAVFTVTLSIASDLDTTVDFATADVTATAGADYTATTGTLTIPAGQTTGTIAVPVTDDALFEGDEAFTVNLSNPVGLNLTDSDATATITDDDPQPVLSVAGASVTEGDSGTTPLVFAVTLSAAAGVDVTVNFTTADVTATAGTDYAVAVGTLTIPAGQVTGTVAVAVTGDVVSESDETFLLNLSSPTNATLGISQATGTIVDDDAPPVVTVGDVSIPEGNAAATLTLVAVLTPAAPVDVVFPFATRDGTATAGSDYTPTSGMLTIPAGQTTGTIDVTVLGETLFEGDETFFLDVGTATATVTLANDDPAPAVSIGSASLTEGNTPGTPTPLVFPVTLSAASAVPVVLSFTTADGTATAGSDYTATTGTLTIAAGQTTSSLTVAVPVLGDTTVEPDETFLVNLSVVSGGATPATSQATGTIVNDDQPPANSVFQITAVAPVVGEDQGALLFMVSRTVPGGSSLAPAAVSFSLSGTASLGLDYTIFSSTVSFAAGESSKTLALALVNDALFEENESVVVTLTGPGGGSVGAAGSAVVTLADDEARFIDALYMKVLGRPADPLGRSSAIFVLAPNNTIGARALVADFVQQSPEGKAVIIERLYQTILNRPADTEARVLGARALELGVGEADIAVFLLASDEFGARHPGNAGYVTALVRLIFEREPTAGEVAAGVSALDTGLRSRATLAYQLLSTTEAFGRAVDDYFEFYLERPADAPTRDSLVAALATGNFDPRRAAFVFIGSDEFYIRAVNGLLTFADSPLS